MGKGGGAMAKGEMISFLEGVIVEVDANDAGSEAAEVLGVVEKAERMFGGGMTKIVPIAEGWGREASEEGVPEIVRGNFAGIFSAFEAKAETEGGSFFT